MTTAATLPKIVRIRSAHHDRGLQAMLASPEIPAADKRRMLTQAAEFESELKRLRRAALKRGASADTILDYLTSLSSEQVAHSICEVFKRLDHPPEVFWPVVMFAWGVCDCAWYNTKYLLHLFTYYKKAAKGDIRRFYDDAHEAKIFDDLPDELTIFRGCNVSRAQGLSWTTDRNIAEGFAHGHRGMQNEDAVVVVGKITKCKIFFALSGRAESEVVCWPRHEIMVPYTD